MPLPFPSFQSVKTLAGSLSNNKVLKFCGAGNATTVDDNVEAHSLDDYTLESSNHSPDSLTTKKEAPCDRGPVAETEQVYQNGGQHHHPRLSLTAPVLENTGSVARDHLANERTWLAYIRTSITISGTGIALVQLFASTALNDAEMVISAAGVDLINFGNELPRIVRPLGCAIVLGGFGVLLIGIYRYFTVQNALQKGLFPTARSLVLLTSAVLIAFIAINFGLLLTIPD